MKKTLKKYFIPHEANEHRPHFLREKSVATTLLVAGVLFVASLFGNYIVRTTPQLASIKSAFLVDLTNEDRAKEGLPELRINDKLVAAAGMKAADMAAKEYFAHQSPDGRQPWDFIKASGYSYVYAGENLAVNFYDSDEVEEAWMDSPSHRKNILNNRYTEIGIATASGRYKGDSTTYVVQMFGRPNTVAAAPTPAPRATEVAVVEESPVAPEETSNVLGEEVEVSAPAPIASRAEPIELAAAAPVAAPAESTMEFTNPEASDAELAVVKSAPAPTEDVPTYTTWFERLIVSPSEVVQNLYMVLFALVVFSLILKIFIEIRLQHPKNIAYGILLLIVIFGFMHMNQGLGETTIVAMQSIAR